MVLVVRRNDETIERLRHENDSMNGDMTAKAALERQLGALRVRMDQLERDKEVLKGENEDLQRQLNQQKHEKDADLRKTQMEECTKAKQELQVAEAKWRRDLGEVRE